MLPFLTSNGDDRRTAAAAVGTASSGAGGTVRTGGGPVATASTSSAVAFPPGSISEVIPSGQESGPGLLVAGLMGEPEELSPRHSFILTYGGDGFDPSSLNDAAYIRIEVEQFRVTPIPR